MTAPLAGDPRFFECAGPFPLARIAEAIGIPGPAEAVDRLFAGVAPLQHAGPDQVSFLSNRQYLDALAETRAGAVIIDPSLAERVPAGTIALATATPYTAWAHVAALFHPLPSATPGVHPSAVVDATARIGARVQIGPQAVIEAGAEIGDDCRIGATTVIGPGVAIGAGSRIGPQVTISHAILGARVVISPGTRIGQDGFGFDVTPQGFLSVPQLGRVVIEDGVEIGANCTIDRGSAQDTVIGAGSRLDNLVQIGHNVRIGRGCVLVSQVGISGSTTLEDHVMIGGQAGLTGHLRIGRGAKVGAQAGVMADVPAGVDVIGSPAEPIRDFFRQVAFIRRLIKREQAARRETKTG